MKSNRFYGKSKTPAILSRLLDLAEENARPYQNEDGQFSVTILPPTNARVILQTKIQEMKMAPELSITCREACF